MNFNQISKLALAGVVALAVSCGSKGSGDGSSSSADSAQSGVEAKEDSLAQAQKLQEEAEAAARKAEADSIAAVEAAAKAEADAKAEKKAMGFAGVIKASDGVNYTLMTNGRWTANKGYIKSGNWARDGKVIDIMFDNADGNCFYYNGAIYELGSECYFDKTTLRGEDAEGNPVSLAENKNCNATIEWY